MNQREFLEKYADMLFGIFNTDPQKRVGLLLRWGLPRQIVKSMDWSRSTWVTVHMLAELANKHTVYEGMIIQGIEKHVSKENNVAIWQKMSLAGIQIRKFPEVDIYIVSFKSADYSITFTRDPGQEYRRLLEVDEESAEFCLKIVEILAGHQMYVKSIARIIATD